MKYCAFILFFVTLHFNILLAQSPVPIIKSGIDFKDSPLIFVDDFGKELFKLSKTQYFNIESSSVDFRKSFFDNYSLDVFHDEMLLVNSMKNYYVLNPKGDTLIDFKEKYRRIHPYKDNFFLANEIIFFDDRKTKKIAMTYLNRDGTPAFKGKQFEKATNFSNGFAVVKTLEEKEWLLIDTSGNEILNITNKFDAKVKNVFPLKDGIVKISVASVNKPSSSKKVFINTNGEIIIDFREKRYNVLGNNSISHLSKSTYLLVNSVRGKKEKTAYVFNEIGEKTNEVHHIKSYSFTNKSCIFELFPNSNTKEKLIILNSDGTIENALFGKGQSPIRFCTIGSSNIVEFNFNSKNIKEPNTLYSISPFKEIFSTNLDIKGYNNERILLWDVSRERYVLKSIDGHKEIWQTPIGKQVFTSSSLPDALKHSDEIITYRITKIEDIENGVLEFKNLKELAISELHEITKLPQELSTLKNLETLKLVRLPKLASGVEYVIENIASLKNVEIIGCPLVPKIKTEILKKRPELKIHSDIDEPDFEDFIEIKN